MIEDISANGIVLDGLADPAGGSVNDRITHNTIRLVGRDYSEAVVKGIYLDEGSVEFTVSRNLVELPWMRR